MRHDTGIEFSAVHEISCQNAELWKCRLIWIRFRRHERTSAAMRAQCCLNNFQNFRRSR